MPKTPGECFTYPTGEVNIGNWDEMPLGIDLEVQTLGCVRDTSTGEITGIVRTIYLADEKTQSVVTRNVAYMEDGTIIDPYEGPWQQCEEPQIERLTWCNPDTQTKWIRVLQYRVSASGAVTETIVSDTDTGFPCSEYTVIENVYCVTD